MTDKGIREVRDGARNVSRPLRGATIEGGRRNERIAARTVQACGDRHVDWLRAIFDLIPDLPSWGSTMRAERESNKVPGWHWQTVGCGCCREYVPKAFPAGHDLAAINAEFTGTFGAGIAAKWEQLVSEYVRDVVGESPADLRPGTQTIYGRGMNAQIQSNIDDARQAAEREYNRQPRWWREQNPFPEFFDRTYWEGAQYIDRIYTNGFGRITATVTIQFSERAKQIIVDGNRQRLTYAQIARDLNNTIGVRSGRSGAGLYHWQRLVRSEMADAITDNQKETYRRSGVEYLRYNAAAGHCDICGFWMSENGGIYTYDSMPDIIGDTHPNCRCRILPIYNLNADTGRNLTRPDNPHMRPAR